VKKWIIFDVMGVIFKVGDDTNDLLVPFIQKHNQTISRKTIIEAYMDASLGRITADVFWHRMRIDKQGDGSDLSKEYLDSYLTIDEKFIQTAKLLKVDYHLGILSNDVSEWSAYLRKKYGLDDLVEFSMISSDVKCRKPSRDIYQLAIKETGADARSCIFIDDREKNLVPAMEEGMHTIRFLRDEQETKLDYIPVISCFSQLKEKVDFIMD
jgi:putative hydrolase of the HAD superfamily